MENDFVFESANWKVTRKRNDLYCIQGKEDTFVCRLSPVKNFEQQLGVPENFESDHGET